MSAGSCEESVSAALDTLFDGAILLAGDPVRAEALVLDATSGACAEFAGSYTDADFDTWLVTRMIRRWFDAHGAADIDEPLAEAAARRAGYLDDVLAELSRIEAEAPDSLPDLIRGAMNELPLAQRAVLWMVNVAGFSYAEAARAVGSDRFVVAETLFAARRSLQYLLAVALRGKGQADAGAA